MDYVRLDGAGRRIGLPFCYRDLRTEARSRPLSSNAPREEFFALSGAQPLRINTLFQLMADQAAGVPATARWVNLPEYVLASLGGRMVAEYTNATHTGLVDMRRRAWCQKVFDLSGLQIEAAPPLVATGTDVGELRSFEAAAAGAFGTRGLSQRRVTIPRRQWRRFRSTAMTGPISAPAPGLSSERCLITPITTAEACSAGFTNQGAAGDRVCFHKNVNGMWLLKQTLAQLCPDGERWPMQDLIAAAESLPAPDFLLDVDDPDLLLPGAMASRINAQRRRQGRAAIEETPRCVCRGSRA